MIPISKSGAKVPPGMSAAAAARRQVINTEAARSVIPIAPVATSASTQVLWMFEWSLLFAAKTSKRLAV
jgi:hypothetical protein